MLGQFIRYYITESSIIRNEDDMEIIKYGMKIFGTSILTSLIIVILGILLGQPLTAIIYLSILILLRRNTGGYHSKTYPGCLLITSINFIIIVLLEKNLNHILKEIMGIIFVIYSSIKIYTSKPKIHKNRIINKEAINKSSIKKDNWLIIILALATVLHILAFKGLTNDINYFFATSSSLMIVALSINNKIKEEGTRDEESYNQGYRQI